MKSGNLNFLEPSGPLQACNGTDLALLENFNSSIRLLPYIILEYYLLWPTVGERCVADLFYEAQRLLAISYGRFESIRIHWNND